MVGLKSVWITISALFLLAACVPQTKQTACGDNEAYNSSLRTCVPTTNDPSSYITISSFIPTASYSRFKNDLTPMTFRINISNPYQQSYTTRWIRTYNGQSTDVTSIVDSPTQWDIYPLFFVNEVGLHLLTVDILDSSSNIVATHGFQFTINNSPRPFIDTASINTTSTNPVILNPTSSTKVFSLSIKNNGASIPATSTYRTDWNILNNGVVTTILAPDSASENFADITSTGVNSTDLNFNPSSVTGYGLGSFVIRARVIYTPSNEVVDERQWFVTVEQPPLKKITGRALIEGSGLNPLTFVNAYVGVDHTSNTTYNFRPITTEPTLTTAMVLAGSQADFCVRVADGSGTYPDATDALGVKVSFLLDGAGAALYEASTTTADPEICLTDAGNTNLNQVFFSDVTNPHTIVARVYDEATDLEYSTSNMASGLSTYPVTWKIKVKPQNAPPTIAFGTVASNISCGTLNLTERSNCTVSSDTQFTVSVRLTGDDFYVLPAYVDNFTYSIALFQNTIKVQECTPTDAGEDGLTDLTATDRTFQCVFTAPGFDSTGPIDPTTANYEIVATVSDTQSEITGDPATSSSIKWKIATVNEVNASLGAVLNGPGVANEGANAAFSIDVTDLERDDFNYEIRYCTSAVGCTTSAALVTSTRFDRNTNANPINVPVSTFIREDFLNNVATVTGCANVDRGLPCTVLFFARVIDDPISGSVAARTVDSATVPVDITNINPAPTFNEAAILPLANQNETTPIVPTTLFTNMVGIPFTISAPFGSAILDTSAEASEQINRYQWFAKNNTSVTAWTAISGATGANLIWTPGLIEEVNLGTDNPIQLKLCVEDRSTGVVPSPLTEATAALCTDGIWETTVYNNIITIQDPTTNMALVNGDDGRETAVWNDSPATLNGVTASQVFTVYVDSSNLINVKRSLLKNNGEVLADVAGRIVTFQALRTGLTADVRDLSVTGDADELYIAYRASSTSAPASYFPQVRRIQISGNGNKLAPNTNPGKYGFSYAGITISAVGGVGGDVTITNNAVGGNPTINFTPAGTSTGSISILFDPLAVGAPAIAAATKAYAYEPGATQTAIQICADCSGTVQATDFARIVNESVDNLDKGITAVAVGSTVTIHGSTALDYYDGSAVTSPQVSDDMGDIYIHGTEWYLPFINSSLGGSDKDKISAITGPIGSNIALPVPTVISSVLSPVVALSNMATAYNGTDLYVAGLAKSGSAVKIYQLDADALTVTNSRTNGMSGVAHTDVEIAASGNNVFVTTTTASTPVDNFVGIYSTTIGLADEFKLSETTNVDSATQAIFNGTDIKSLRLVPVGTEARLVASSESASNGVQLFMARLYSNGTDWLVTCKDCVQASHFTQEVSEFVRINVSPVRVKNLAGTDYTLGSVGATANQNKKNVFMVSFAGAIDTTTDSEPHLGVFNSELDQSGSTTLLTGDEDAGLFRPPFFKN